MHWETDSGAEKDEINSHLNEQKQRENTLTCQRSRTPNQNSKIDKWQL